MSHQHKVMARRFHLCRLTIFGLACALLVLGTATTGFAQITPSKESLSGLYPGKAYSPYAQRSFPDRVFWGDTHLHTGLSMDAGLFGCAGDVAGSQQDVQVHKQI